MLDEGREAYIGHDKVILLNKNNFELLKLLLDNKGKIVTMQEIIYTLYGDIKIDSYFKRCIHQRIYLLRKKLAGEIEIFTKCTFGYYIK